MELASHLVWPATCTSEGERRKALRQIAGEALRNGIPH